MPSWFIVATLDHAIHPDAERDMAKRAGSEIIEIDASHAVPVSQPAAWPRSSSARSGRAHERDGRGGSYAAAGDAKVFGPVQQIAAGVLDVGYVDMGPSGGQAVLLLHGWPYDIHSYADVAAPLAAAGYRVLVPYLRGYGTTRFLPTMRPGTGSSPCWPSMRSR